MKYVIFKSINGAVIIPVIIPDHCVHSQIKISGFQPVSAGFFFLNANLFFLPTITDQISVSLKLGPKPGDAELIRNVLLGAPTSAFLDYDELDKTK